MEATNEIIQRSNRDVVKEVTMEWTVSRLKGGDIADPLEWRELAVAHGKMVLLGRVGALSLSHPMGFILKNGYGVLGHAPGRDREGEWKGVWRLIHDLKAAYALLQQLRQHVYTLDTEHKYRLNQVWTRRQLRTLKSCVGVVTKAIFVNAAYGGELGYGSPLFWCQKCLLDLAEYLPEPSPDLARLLITAEKGTIPKHFPWLDYEVLEAIA